MGIVLAAAIATLASLLAIGGVLAWKSADRERWVLALLVLTQLPGSPVLFYGIRLPLEGWLDEWGLDPGTRRFLGLLFRALLEELIKLWPLLIPSVWKSMTPQRKLWRALALGLGFGIGELWLLAAIVFFNDPAVARQDVWELVGFINERAMVCLIHGALCAVAMRRIGPGILLAFGLHAAGNLPFYLQEIGAFGLSPPLWTNVVRTWVLWYFFAMCALVWTMAGGELHLLWLLFGDVKCKNCGMVYPRASLSWTLRVTRRDRCPYCNSRNEYS